MAAWSSLGLKNIAKGNLVRTVIAAPKNGLNLKAFNYIPVRTSGHERTLRMEASRFDFRKVKDTWHFYTMLGILPIIIVATYCNIFIGPAKLALIPEGYEPQKWEYFQHPIQRFLAKYVVKSPQETHERNLHYIFSYREQQMLNELEKKVKQLMRERQDYRAWYYLPPPAKYDRAAYELGLERKENDDARMASGTLL